MMMKSLWPLPAAWALHVLLWLAWPAYSYAYKVPLPEFLETLIIKMFHYHKIEDLPDARRYSCLIAGFVVWAAIGLITAAVLRARARKAEPRRGVPA